ncbi:transmembrane protein 183 [Elysia marginata]|uniref:Transmembrane protein 183 n=1 Tax=Elysia marginata TaxID=1093978 RepID=A0AAV4G8N6_9GAST|nr:transmembrane protein 183 [Elysia marginata]
MPKNGKAGRKRHSALVTSDITVNDFANCTVPSGCGRLKKSMTNNTNSGALANALTGAAKEAATVKQLDDLEWFEKDLEDFVIEDKSEDVSEDGEDLPTEKAPQLKTKKKSKSKKDVEGRIYPEDLWYILSEHIDPQDVGRFAGICHATHSVTRLSSFWRKLYARHYKESPGVPIPDYAKPTSIERLHGLRARVIRSLFVLHPLLAARVQSKGPMEDEPHSLKGHRCLVMWHQPGPKGWQFCFKFQKPALEPLSSRPARKLDVYHGFNDLHYNPEEGCSVLQVTCCHFSSDAAVMGLLLTQVYVTLSTGFRHHRLRLHFDTRVSNSHNSPCDNIVVLDDVVAIKVFKWWHPSYPFIH